MFRTFTITLLIIGLAGCGQEGRSVAPKPEAAPTDSNSLVIAAGSEIKGMAPLLEQMRSETGVSVVPKYMGTLDGIERIKSGEQVDGVWFSHAKYMMLIPEAARKVKASEKIMLSPVIIGVKAGKAKQFGWNASTPWEAIARQAGQGKFKFAMTNPASSNSGFSALVGVAASFAGKSDALEEKDIDSARMATLFRGQVLTSGSSGWLSDRYVAEQDNLDGIINYESVLLSLNRSGQLKEPLTLIYPQDGVLTADYPLMLLNDAKRPAYEKAVAWLKSAKAQTWIMAYTLRRPVSPAVPADKSLFGTQMVVEMPFPGRQSVINALLSSYAGEQRRPASIYFVLDVSGSMAGERIDNLKNAIRVLAGKDGQGLSDTFARFQIRERIVLIPFADSVRLKQITRAEVSKSNPAIALNAIANAADRLEADGRNTAMYDGLIAAYGQIAQEQARDPNRYYSVVVLTDGKSNRGASLNAFRAFMAGQPANVRQVKTFSVRFGDGDKNALTEVANLTGGKFFDSSNMSLATIFKEIRGYQ